MRRQLRRAFAVLVASAAALLASQLTPAYAQGTFTFRVMTFNIRLCGFDEGTVNCWKNRAPLVAEMVKQSKVGVVCFQEDQGNQDDDLKPLLKGWEFKGRGRNANGRSETCSIAFDTATWSCAESGDFWLSDTPDVPGSNTWGTKYPHKVTWARLESLQTHQQIMFTSTHFYEGQEAKDIEVRKKSANVIRTWLSKHVPKGNIIACGDFNSHVDDPAHAVMTAASPGQQLTDVFDIVHPPEGSTGTCHEFTGTAKKKRIDWILSAGAVKPQSIKIDRWNKDGHYPSDHFAVWCEFDLAGEGKSSTKAPEPQVK